MIEKEPDTSGLCNSTDFIKNFQQRLGIQKIPLNRKLKEVLCAYKKRRERTGKELIAHWMIAKALCTWYQNTQRSDDVMVLVAVLTIATRSVCPV